MAIVNQISNLLNDAFRDAIGSNATLTELDTSSVVSMGNAIAQYDAYEAWFKSLTNRIVKTVYFIRSYKGDERTILRDEHEYGAFVQKVYYDMPNASDNPEWAVMQSDGSYKQSSPYDVTQSPAVSALVFGGQGTWAVEFVRPVDQIRTAFLSDSNMMSFVDGIFVAAENRYEVDKENLVNLTVSTGIASALKGGVSRNLLTEYNAKHVGNELTVAQALESLDFLKFANKEILHTKMLMGRMSVNYNKLKYKTFTSDDRLVVEMLDEYVAASEMYLQADTFHDEFVKLPNFERVPYWQGPGSGEDAGKLSETSKIVIKHKDINDGNVVTQGGIICFMHDIEYAACYFGHRRVWDKYNERDDVMIHGETARKGFAIDNHANAIVFYVA